MLNIIPHHHKNMNNNKNNRFYLIYIIFLFITINNFIHCQLAPISISPILTITEPTSTGNTYYGYPQSTSSLTCGFNLQFIIIDEIGSVDGISFTYPTQSFVVSLIQSKNNKFYLYEVSLQEPLGIIYGTTYIPFSISKNTISSNYSISYECKKPDYRAASVSIMAPFKYNQRFYSIIKVTNVSHNISILSTSTNDVSYPIGGNVFLFVWGPKYIESSIGEPTWSTSINFGSENYSILETNSPINAESSIYLTQITRYPSNGSETVEEFGYRMSPLLSFVTNSTENDPYQGLVYNAGDSPLSAYPISGTKGNMTYISFFPDSNSPDSKFVNYFLKYFSGITIQIALFPVSIKKFKEPYPAMQPLSITNLNSNPNLPMFDYLLYTIDNLFYIFKIDYKSFSLTRGFPFGYSSGSSKLFRSKVTLPISKSSLVSQQILTVGISPFLNQQQKIYVNSSTQNLVDSDPPTLHSYEFIQIKGHIYLLRIVVSDSSGISLVSSVNPFFSIKSSAKLVSGNIYNGTYEMVVNVLYTVPLYIVDGNENALSLSNGKFYELSPMNSLKYIEPFTESLNSIAGITNISFLHNDLNLNNGPSYNRMYITWNGIPQDQPLSFFLRDPVSLDIYEIDVWPLVWNSSLNQFIGDFVLKQNNLFGNVPFTIIGNTNYEIYNTFFNSSYQLRVSENSILDGSGPIFSNIKRIPNGRGDVLITTVSNSIGWMLTIQDEINGFEKGYIKVVGSYDNSIYHFNFSLNDLIQGDKYNGDYNILIELKSPCQNQTLVMTDIILEDSNGITSNFNLYSSNSNPVTNPFRMFLNNTYSNKITYICAIYVDDITPPVLESFVAKTYSLDGLIDVGSMYRIVSFEFQASEDKTPGIKRDQYPIVYIMDKSLNLLECVSNIKSISENTIDYNCTIEIPVGFGYPGELLFSVYGFISSGGYSGFATSDLNASGFSYFINTTLSSGHPIITDNYKPTLSNGGQLILYGISFDVIDSVYIKYLDDGENSNFTLLSTPNVFSQTVIKIDGIKPTIKPYFIKVKNGGKSSNEYKVEPIYFGPIINEPTPTPSNTPTKCLGNPECGGSNNGYCSYEGDCICYSPWIGLDCLSKVVIIPQPIKNTTNPTTTIPINTNDILFSSLISIVSLRELDLNGIEIKSFTFDKWIFTEINQNTSKYYTNITTSNQVGKITTNIIVIIEWFKQETKLIFAGSNLTMNPSSIKYTINIDNYAFKNSLSQLQLIMSAKFESSNENVCSIQEFTENNNKSTDYIKIQIEDHSLYGRFIKRAIIDDSIITINNVLLDQSLNEISSDEPSTSSIQTFIGINIPNFKTSVSIDPDFSILVNSNSASSIENSICSSNSNRLSKTQLAGIIVGSIIFTIAFVTAISYYILKVKKEKKFKNGIENKLKKFSEGD